MHALRLMLLLGMLVWQKPVHWGAVTLVKWSANGQLILTASSDGTSQVRTHEHVTSDFVPDLHA